MNASQTNTLLQRTTATLALLGAFAITACGGGSDAAPDPQPCPDCEAVAGQLRVVNPSAHGCEALVEAAGGRILSIDFASGAVGKMISEGDRAGISFVSSSAGPLSSGGAATIRFTGELTLLSNACYGASGEALVGEGVAL